MAIKSSEEISHWWHSCLLWLYEKLSLNDSLQAADLIFVMAGRMERKQYGLELYRAGMAPRLVLSVGRFEVSKMSSLNLEGVEKLIVTRDETRPDERHFFVEVETSGIRIEKVKLRRWNTYGEALGFRQFLKRQKARSVILVSTDVHLRRVSLTFSRIFRCIPIEFVYCPVPSRLASLKKDRWWMRPDDRRFVMKEMMKLVGYRVILSMPAWATRRLMRLKD